MHEIDRMVLGYIGTNTYILNSEDSNTFIIIDPAAHAETILEQLNGAAPTAILLTHGHFDHMLAVNGILERFPDTPVYCHPDDRDILAHPGREIVWREFTESAVHEFIPIHDGQTLTFGDITLKVIHTPGHTAGGVCYYDEEKKTLFSGDTIFYESYGRTDFITGDEEQLKSSIINKIFGGFNDEDVMMIYPGHGEPTTLAHERLRNPIINI